jgi:hypothetical protein
MRTRLGPTVAIDGVRWIEEHNIAVDGTDEAPDIRAALDKPARSGAPNLRAGSSPRAIMDRRVFSDARSIPRTCY